jgi:hypothetical protein
MKRNSLLYFLLVVITIIAGLASRHFSTVLPPWIHLYLGDTLWALMVFLMVGLIFHCKESRWIALAALLFSFCIEISQLYHAPWIDELRSNRVAGLVLGFGFLWSDLICYSIGVGFGYLMETIISRRSKIST